MTIPVYGSDRGTVGFMGKTSLHSAQTVAGPVGFFFESDFSSDNWTDGGSGIGVNTTNENLEGSYSRSSTNDVSWIDMTGVSLSDTLWVARWEYDITSFTASPTNLAFWGFSDVTGATGAVQSRDGIGIEILHDDDVNKSFKLTHPVGQGWNDNKTSFTTVPTVATFFIELKRLSSTSCTMNIYSNSEFTSLVESKTATISSSINALRYLVNQNLNAGSTGATIVINIDDIQVKNGTSTF